VLIKGAYSAIHPADKNFSSSKSTTMEFNGVEGSGIIIDTGKDVDKGLIGKKVSYFT